MTRGELIRKLIIENRELRAALGEFMQAVKVIKTARPDELFRLNVAYIAGRKVGWGVDETFPTIKELNEKRAKGCNW
jgi:hypothetical protein